MATERDFGNMLNQKAVKTGGSAWIGMKGEKPTPRKKSIKDYSNC